MSADGHGRKWGGCYRVWVSSSLLFFRPLLYLTASSNPFPIEPPPALLHSQSFFHVDCFKCAKCHERVTADTNLLLLSDGQPVCSNCSYKCSVCHQPILDEAIMTGDDSYHAHCFKCRSCHNRIDELMFAKTSHGIYCMKCHNQRVARSRRHAQKQKERENAAIAGGGSNSHGAPTKQPPAPHGVCRSCLLVSSASYAHIYHPERVLRTHYPRFSG